ncbi:Rv1733c family protein [Streptosporangium soli]|nr:hypothetical protein [Streptosporangium sp. KLBMP 9127]
MKGRNRWVARQVRLYRLDRNPLRRRWDRIEAFVVAIVLVLSMAGVPFAVRLGLTVYEQGVTSERSGRWVSGRLVSNAPAARWADPEGGLNTVKAPARWPLADGGSGTGMVDVPEGSKAGSPVRIWLDASGKPVTKPPERATTVAKAVVAGSGVMLLGFGTLLLAYGATRCLLDRRRHTAWEEEWAAADRRWHKGPSI